VVNIAKSYSSREVVRILKDDGWYFDSQVGSHKHYKHPLKAGKATVVQGKEAVPRGTLNGIEMQTGLKFR